MDQRSDFFVTLSSQDSIAYYPSNTSSNFVCHLNPPVVCPEDVYEIGLAQFKSNFTNNNEDPEDTQRLFFGSTEKDNLIKVIKKNKTVVNFEKKGKSATEFYQLLAAKLKILEQPIELSLAVHSAREVRVKLKFTGESDRVLEIPETMAAILGFEQTRFSPGEYVAVNDKNNTLFDFIKDGLIYQLLITHTSTEEVEVGEPSSDKLIDVIACISKAVEKLKTNVQIERVDKCIILNIRSKSVNLSLPAAMNSYFGFPLQYTFTGTSSFTIPVHLLQMPKVGYEAVYVLCDASNRWKPPVTSLEMYLSTIK